MRKILGGNRPDITPAQVIAGIPVIATLLHVFGVYHLSKEQEDALTSTVEYAFVLLGADAAIRIGRAHSDGKVKAAALQPSPVTLGPDPRAGLAPPLAPEEIEDEVDREPSGDFPRGGLPTDAEEEAFPPPAE